MGGHFEKQRNSVPAPLLNDSSVTKQRDMPPSLYADFIESGTPDDIDFFLTRVSQIPAIGQNKVLQ